MENDMTLQELLPKESKIAPVSRLGMSVAEMAKSLNIGINQASNLVHIQGFPALRSGKKWIVLIKPLEKWLEDHKGLDLKNAAR